MIMITPLPGITSTKPGSATQPFPGVFAEIRDTHGNRVETGGGLLTLTKPWPAMLRGIYRRSAAIRRDVLEPLARRLVLHRRRRATRRGRVLLAARPRGRRSQRRRPSPGHDGGGERARRSPERGRGGGRRTSARDQGAGGCRVRHPEGRRASHHLRWSTSSRSTSSARSARSRDRTRFCLPPTCRRRGPGRSCAGCCATSLKARRSGTRQRWRTRVVARLKRSTRGRVKRRASERSEEPASGATEPSGATVKIADGRTKCR